VNKLLIGWRPYVIAAVAICALAVLYFTMRAQDDRFGDPAVLEQIKTSTDCDELRTWSDAVLVADSQDDAAFDKAVGYSNAANDRMKELNCQ
jgi:anti-sigma-K factor RskA